MRHPRTDIAVLGAVGGVIGFAPLGYAQSSRDIEQRAKRIHVFAGYRGIHGTRRLRPGLPNELTRRRSMQRAHADGPAFLKIAWKEIPTRRVRCRQVGGRPHGGIARNSIRRHAGAPLVVKPELPALYRNTFSVIDDFAR